jgi:hypothetical protein
MRLKTLATRSVLFTGLLISLAACSGGSPTSPSDKKLNCAAESACTDIAPSPLSGDELQMWLDKARDEVRGQIETGDIRTASVSKMDWSEPRIDWRSCPFVVENAYYGTGTGTVCAAGMTDRDKNRIVISTFDKGRRGPLVYWEFRNLLWIRAGVPERAY